MKIGTAFSFLLFLAAGIHAYARPWNPASNAPDHISNLQVDIVPQASPLTATIDSLTIGISRTLKTLSPSMVPLFSVAALSYIGYVGSVMFAPAAVAQFGLPLLDDFSMETRLSRSVQSTQGFVDSLATGFMQDVLGKTEAADILRNTSTLVAKNSMETLMKTTRSLNVGIGSLQDTLHMVINALSPGCLSRHMCQVGQFTTVNFPILGSVLRSIDVPDLDDYAQALIDGTTVGDCSAVFHDCPL